MSHGSARVVARDCGWHPLCGGGDYVHVSHQQLYTKAARAMNHRQVLELAGWLAEHGADVAGRCRGIKAAALRRYHSARQTQFHAWLEVLVEKRHGEFPAHPIADSDTGHDALTTVQEIAPHGVLVRVASTILYSIGERLDIPLAMDVANQTARSFDSVAHAATAALALRSWIPAQALSDLARIRRVCDRLSDLLCGSLLPTLRCDRFAVDRERAADFANTYGCQPSLVRVPIRKSALVVPAAAPTWRDLAVEVEQSLLACLPTVVNFRGARPDELTDLTEIFGPRLCHFSKRDAKAAADVPSEPARPLAFPTLSFARVFRKRRES
jgi:hypothetical protein